MANTWFTKVSHFLNEDGELPADLTGPARNLAAEANHNPDRKIQEALDALYDSLDALLDAYLGLKD
jgi:hypothetical protein